MSTATNFNTNVKTVKALLKQHPDGLTVNEIALMTGISYTSAHNACHRVKGIYVDRWTLNDRGKLWIRVFCLGWEDDAPKPDARPVVYKRAAEAMGAR